MSARRRFSILWFSVQVIVQYVLLLLGFRFLLPTVWNAQTAAGAIPFVLVFLASHLGLCFFEWAFHRYVLHSLTTRWLIRLTRGHRHHHSLTPIRLQPVAEGSERFVFNRYPITESEQYPDSAFPVYATVAFWLLFTPVFVVLQWAMLGLPILLGGYTAVTWSMCLYEVLHAIEHQPYEWWKRATEDPRLGFLWRRLYGFHHMHHANISCNEAISGFFGLPIADWVLGTYHQPRELLLEGRVATARDFAIPNPPPLVRWLDRWARQRESSEHRHD